MNIDLKKYKELIQQITLAKNSEQNIQKKKTLEDFEIKLKKGFRTQELVIKLHSLYNNKQFIAYICVVSQLSEFKIKEAIIQFQELFNLLNKNIALDKNWEEKTLGGLITILEKHYIDDPAFIEKLRDFNNLRIKAIHKLFDIAFEIKDVENEIETKLTPSVYYKNTFIPIQEYVFVATTEIFKIKDKENQVPREAKTIVEKLSEEIEKTYSDFKKEDIIKNIKI